MKDLASLVVEIDCCAERLDGPGIEGHEREWLSYVKRCLYDVSHDLKQIQEGMMAGHISGTDEIPQADALPDAAWYAEHIMKWHKDWQEMPGNIMMHHAWFDADGVFQAWVTIWNPKIHDADALQLWKQVPAPKSLTWRRHEMIEAQVEWQSESVVGGTLVELSDFCLTICRAVYAWWLAQQGVHHTGTGEETL